MDGYAECPGCSRSTVVLRVMRLWRMSKARKGLDTFSEERTAFGGRRRVPVPAPDPTEPHAEQTGELVRCLRCGTQFGVLLDGSVVRCGDTQPERSPASERARNQAATGGDRDGRGGGFDSLLETLPDL